MLPDRTTPNVDLPDIRFVDSLESGCHINAPVQVTYDALENLARPHVEKAHNRKRIVFENLTLYGSGTQLAADVEFRMPFLGATGQLYLLGAPASDTSAMSLFITELNYAFTEQSLLLKIVENKGEGIFSNLQTTVEEKLAFPITALHEKLSEVIAYHKIGSHAALSGRGIVGDPSFTQTGMFIPLRLHGDLDCEIHLSAAQFP